MNVSILFSICLCSLLCPSRCSQEPSLRRKHPTRLFRMKPFAWNDHDGNYGKTESPSPDFRDKLSPASSGKESPSPIGRSIFSHNQTQRKSHDFPTGLKILKRLNRPETTSSELEIEEKSPMTSSVSSKKSPSSRSFIEKNDISSHSPRESNTDNLTRKVTLSRSSEDESLTVTSEASPSGMQKACTAQAQCRSYRKVSPPQSVNSLHKSNSKHEQAIKKCPFKSQSQAKCQPRCCFIL